MPVLHDLECVTFEVNLAIEIHFVEGLHWDPIPASVFGLVFFGVEVQVVLDRSSRVASLLVHARRHAGSHGPEGYEDRKGCEQSKEYPCLETSTNFPRKVTRNQANEGEKDVVVEILAACSICRKRSILDCRILYMKN